MAPPFRKLVHRTALAGPAGAQALVVNAAVEVVAKVRRAAARTEGNPEARLHRMRVAIKRLRSYWRLVRPHLSAAAGAAERDRLRAVARSLAAFRDADVAAPIVAGLLNKTRDPATRALLQRWARRRRALAGGAAARERALRQALRQLLTVPVRLAEPPPVPEGWLWLEPGLARAYRRGRRCFQACRKGASDEEFHEWRRRIKDLQYFTELLTFLAPHRLGQRLKRIARVADALGDAHDLVELRNGLTAAHSPVQRGRPATAPGLGGALRRRLEHRITAHYRVALREARPLYSTPPAHWLRVLRADWERWDARRPRPTPATNTGLKPDMIHGVLTNRVPQ